MKLPEHRRQRIALCALVAVLAPFLMALVTICAGNVLVPALAAVFGWGSWDYQLFKLLSWIGAVIGGGISALALLALPIRHRLRIASAAGSFVAVLYSFNWFIFVASLALYVATTVPPALVSRLSEARRASLPGPTGPTDPEREAAWASLRHSLYDPDFEEVRWWPALPLPGYSRIAAGATLVAPGECRVARIKYRCKNNLGEWITVDDLFIFADGTPFDQIGVQFGLPPEGTVGRDLWERRDELFPE